MRHLPTMIHNLCVEQTTDITLFMHRLWYMNRLFPNFVMWWILSGFLFKSIFNIFQRHVYSVDDGEHVIHDFSYPLIFIFSKYIDFVFILLVVNFGSSSINIHIFQCVFVLSFWIFAYSCYRMICPAIIATFLLHWLHTREDCSCRAHVAVTQILRKRKLKKMKHKKIFIESILLSTIKSSILCYFIA